MCFIYRTTGKKNLFKSCNLWRKPLESLVLSRVSCIKVITLFNAILFELHKNANAIDDDETQVPDEDESQGNSVPSSEGTQQVVTGLIALRCNQT